MLSTQTKSDSVWNPQALSTLKTLLDDSIWVGLVYNFASIKDFLSALFALIMKPAHLNTISFKCPK